MAVEIKFDYALADFISFRDTEACERVRRIPRSEIQDHPNADFRIRVVDDRAELYESFAEDIVARIGAAADEGRAFVGIFPVGPMPQYAIAARAINEQRLSCRRVHSFNMDEYANEDGETAPASWPGSFQRAMLASFFGAIDAELRPLEENVHFPTKDKIGDYSSRIEALGGADVCYGGIGWGGDNALLGMHPWPGVGRGLQSYKQGGGPPVLRPPRWS